MDKKTINKILITVGFVVSILLFVAAGLVFKGQQFAQSQVKDNLVQEQIFFPPKGVALDPKTFPGLQQYAGQQVDTGTKAKAYANEYIWVHMMESSNNKTYAQISNESRAAPSDAKLAGLKATLFQGDMLRSSLLTAYAFSVFGQIAHYATIALVAAGGLVLVLSLVLLGTFATSSSSKSKSTKKKGKK